MDNSQHRTQGAIMLEDDGKQDKHTSIQMYTMAITAALLSEMKHMSQRVRAREAADNEDIHVGSTVNGKDNEDEQKRNDRNGKELSASWNCPVDERTMHGLKAPVMDSTEKVTGANKERHRIKNKREQVEKQAKQ